MACPQRSGNTLSFSIPGGSDAAVVVCFEGSKHKKVLVEWGDGSSYMWDSCDPGITPGEDYPVHHLNTSADTLSAMAKVFYEDALCPEAVGTLIAANTSETLVENCNPGDDRIVICACKFDAPDQTDTVQVTVVIEDSNWTGDE